MASIRNQYGRTITQPIRDWPGIEAPSKHWLDAHLDPPPIGILVDVIWAVGEIENKTIRWSFSRATFDGDRRWLNENGLQIVFGPQLWRDPADAPPDGILM